MTKRQRDVYLYIEKFISENGYSPSYREISAEIGVKSISNINRIVVGLSERGKIKFNPRRARSIEIV